MSNFSKIKSPPPLSIHLGIIPEVSSRRIANDALGKIPPHRVGKVQFIRIEYGIFIQRQNGIRLNLIVGQESL